MKRRGIFAILAGMLAAISSALKTRPTYSIAAYRGEGRSAFYSVSAPRCHTQRKRFRGFAR